MDTEAMFEAIGSRNPKYNSAFVFAVSTTGIYCRPTCPSRRPDRGHVAFFISPADARAAGYRPCMRCEPDGKDNRIEMIKYLCRFIEENYDSKLTLASLAQEAALSEFHFQRVFKKLVGVTPRQYVEQIRLRRARHSLKRGMSVRKSSYSVGYNTSNWLYSNCKLGMSPGDYKSGGEGMEIAYSILDTKLGRLLVAGTKYGVCAVALGENDSRLIAFLQTEYPRAEVRESEGNGLQNWIKEIVRFIIEKRRINYRRLPIDIQATAFQMRILKEIQGIPFGNTLSYVEIARKVESPDAARAVGNACASNPVALVIPCHRVVKSDGELGGYRWGLERKRKLLELEGVKTQHSSSIQSK
ncbi:MAG: bifunctional transcriptional activator/DNA repair enzyme AdaA [Nitrososphaerales archaeon]